MVENKELTVTEQLMADTKKKIDKYRLNSESSLVASLFKDASLVHEYGDLKLEDFSNNYWRCLYVIARELVTTKHVQNITSVEFGKYLAEHEKLKKVVESAGGWELVEKAVSYIDETNIKSYYDNLRKWTSILALADKGFPIADDLSKLADMTMDEVYCKYDSVLQNVFSHAESNYQSYELMEGIEEYIKSLDAGEDLGYPIAHSDIINNIVGGLRANTITGIGAGSGTGKSWLSWTWVATECIRSKTPLLMIINEESEARYKRELIIYVANQILGKKLTKKELQRGHFNKYQLAILKETADWIREAKESHLITIVPLEKYTCATAVAIIKKYSNLGVKRVILDTFKPSADASNSEQSWKAMMEDSVMLYDTVKEASGRDIQMLVTYQLNKSASNARKLNNYLTGVSKNIIDIFSLNFMARYAYTDEYAGGKNALNCYREDNGHKIPFTLDPDKKYMLIFITKSRYSMTGDCIVAEVDMGTNYYKELGFAVIEEEW